MDGFAIGTVAAGELYCCDTLGFLPIFAENNILRLNIVVQLVAETLSQAVADLFLLEHGRPVVHSRNKFGGFQYQFSRL